MNSSCGHLTRNECLLLRRKFLRLAAAAIPTAASWPARADSYPARPVRIIVGYAAGGAPDILARLIGQWLSERLDQPFVIENRPGAGGRIAIETVIKAPTDGYTLLMVALPDAVNATLFPDPNYSFVRDIAPVAAICRDPDVMLVNPRLPVKSVPEFIAYAKANPGKINMASPGVGSSPHMAGALFKVMTGIDMTHVAYRGTAPALTDLLGGHVQVFFAPILASLPYVRAGELRALAVTTTARAGALPDIAALADFVPGFDVSGWFGIGTSKDVPTAVIDRLNTEVNAGLTEPAMKARLADLGSSAFAGSPSVFGKFIADEIKKWADVIKFANIKPD
jgi:tripartite-type tricarboxylate transporter receptor subunit TctC